MKRILICCIVAITTLATFAFNSKSETQQIGTSNLGELLESAVAQTQFTGNAIEITISTKLGLSNITLEDMKEVSLTQSNGTRMEKPKGDGWTFAGHTTLSEWPKFAEKLALELYGGTDYIIYTESDKDGNIYVYYKEV